MADVQAMMEGLLFSRVQHAAEAQLPSLAIVALQSPFPSNFCSLSLLEDLEIGRVERQFEEELNKIGLLAALRSLQLGEGELTAMPDLAQLRMIEHISICNNKIQEVPSWIDCLYSLETVSLIQNDLKAISAPLCRLKNLRVLRLDNNLIEEVPDCIGGLLCLENLSLDHNHVARLSPAITQLSCLKRLSLLGNNLEVLPQELSHCMDTTISSDGSGCRVLPQLTRIDFRDNPLPEGLAVDTSSADQVRTLAALVEACFTARLVKSASEH